MTTIATFYADTPKNGEPLGRGSPFFIFRLSHARRSPQAASRPHDLTRASPDDHLATAVCWFAHPSLTACRINPARLLENRSRASWLAARPRRGTPLPITNRGVVR